MTTYSPVAVSARFPDCPAPAPEWLAAHTAWVESRRAAIEMYGDVLDFCTGAPIANPKLTEGRAEARRQSAAMAYAQCDAAVRTVADARGLVDPDGARMDKAWGSGLLKISPARLMVALTARGEGPAQEDVWTTLGSLTQQAAMCPGPVGEVLGLLADRDRHGWAERQWAGPDGAVFKADWLTRTPEGVWIAKQLKTVTALDIRYVLEHFRKGTAQVNGLSGEQPPPGARREVIVDLLNPDMRANQVPARDAGCSVPRDDAGRLVYCTDRAFGQHWDGLRDAILPGRGAAGAPPPESLQELTLELGACLRGALNYVPSRWTERGQSVVASYLPGTPVHVKIRTNHYVVDYETRLSADGTTVEVDLTAAWPQSGQHDCMLQAMVPGRRGGAAGAGRARRRERVRPRTASEQEAVREERRRRGEASVDDDMAFCEASLFDDDWELQLMRAPSTGAGQESP